MPDPVQGENGRIERSGKCRRDPGLRQQFPFVIIDGRTEDAFIRGQVGGQDFQAQRIIGKYHFLGRFGHLIDHGLAKGIYLALKEFRLAVDDDHTEKGHASGDQNRDGERQFNRDRKPLWSPCLPESLPETKGRMTRSGPRPREPMQ